MRLPVQIFLLFLLFLCPAVRAQDMVINTGQFQDYIDIRQNLEVFETDQKRLIPATFDTAQFKPQQAGITEKNFFKRRLYLLKLEYSGSEPAKTVYFFAGKMVNFGMFFLDSAKGWVRMPHRESFRAISLSSRIALAPLQVKRGKVQQYIIVPDLRYYNWEQWNPALAQPTAVNDLILHEFIQPNFTYSILAILMAGMMFMLFSYSFLKFYLNRRNEYLYNSLFALTFLLFFAVIFINNFYYQPWWHRYSAFFERWLQMLGFIFEFVFIIQFLELRSRKHRLFIFLRAVILGLMVYCCILPFIAFSDVLYPFNNLLFDIVGMLLLGAGLYTAIILHNWNRYLSRYISFGLVALICFLLVIILLETMLRDKQYLVLRVGGPMILYHVGILANLFFFRLALGQKERVEEIRRQEDIEKLQLENEKKELEKVLAIASSRVDERNRIAKEIHDDIGSGLTSIRLLSEIALVKPNNKDELNKISSNANELVNNLNEIIWSINSKNDTIPNLLAYIRSHMVDYLEPYNIRLSINIPSDVPPIEISGEKRRNIFMVIKECFTNIIKHANASAVNFTVQVRDELIFTIKDNGKGFDAKDVLPFKNGIRNMKERIEHVGGEMDIWGKNGTTITIKIPLNGKKANL